MKMNGAFSFRLSAAAVVLCLTGCSVIEPERRAADASTIYEGSRPAAPYVAPVARVAVAAPRGNEAPVWPANAPSVYAESAILIDANSGRVIFQKYADERRQVASTQKLLTALVVAERGNLNEPVRVAASDTHVEPTNLNIRAGQIYTRRELLTAMLVKSCNDVAELFARDCGGSDAGFAALMNARAARLGATSSWFVNPHGLPGPQYSTARDMARIALVAYRNPAIRSIVRMPAYTFRFNNGAIRHLESTNKLLPRSMIYDGMKTGYTYAAGRCLVTSARSGGESLILVQLGSKTTRIFDDAERMIQWGFRSGNGGGLLAQRQ